MAMQNVDIKIVSGASSQWKKTTWVEKGTIDTIPKDKVCLVYRQVSATVMQHTGVYCGNGYVIDARGSATGIVKNKLDSYKWTHWGIPAGLEQSSATKINPPEVFKVLYTATVIASSGSTVNMRSEPNTLSDRVAKVGVGQEVEVLEETNSSWAKIMWGDKTGYMMRTYLKQNTTAPQQEVSWYVRIKCDSQQQAEQLAAILGTAAVAS